MSKIAIITEEQRDLLVGKQLQASWYFNPIKDADDNWVISVEEIDNNQNQEFDWVKELSLTEYKRKEVKPLY
jgi:hypothetical protein